MREVDEVQMGDEWEPSFDVIVRDAIFFVGKKGRIVQGCCWWSITFQTLSFFPSHHKEHMHIPKQHRRLGMLRVIHCALKPNHNSVISQETLHIPKPHYRSGVLLAMYYFLKLLPHFITL